MSKRQSPQSEITCSVRNSSKHKLNSFNELVNEYVRKAFVLFFGCLKMLDLGITISFRFFYTVRIGFIEDWFLYQKLLFISFFYLSMFAFSLYLLELNDWLDEKHDRCTNKCGEK